MPTPTIRPNFRRYLTSASWLLSEQVARMISGLLIGVIIARHLGPEGLGQISYAQSIVGIFAVFSSLGLEGVVIKELVRDPASRDEILGTAFYSMLGAGISVTLILASLANWLGPSPVEQSLILLAALTLPLQAAGVVNFEKQSRASLGSVTRAQLTQVTFSTLLRTALVFLGASVIAFGVANVADSLLLATLFIAIAFKDGLSPRCWRFNRGIAKRLLLQSWPLIFTNLLVAVFIRIDQIMLRNLAGVQDVGEYAVAVRLTGVLVIVPMMIVKAVNPSIIAAQKRDPSFFEQRLQLLYDLGAILSMAGALSFSFISKPIIHLLFGAAYAGSSAVAIIFVWCSVWITIGQINAITIIAAGNTYQVLTKALIGVLFNIVLNYVFISRYGINGAAFATLISYIISTHLLMLIFPEQRKQFRLASRSLIIPLAAYRIFRFINTHRKNQ